MNFSTSTVFTTKLCAAQAQGARPSPLWSGRRVRLRAARRGPGFFQALRPSSPRKQTPPRKAVRGLGTLALWPPATQLWSAICPLPAGFPGAGVCTPLGVSSPTNREPRPRCRPGLLESRGRTQAKDTDGRPATGGVQ